jgi:tetratricopeptide (TPR) repeat protein
VALSALAVFSGLVFVREYRCGQAADLAARASLEINGGNFPDAIPLVDQAIAIDPSAYHFSVRALARAAAHMPRFAAGSPAPAAQSEQDRSELRAALADYNRATDDNPDDDLFPRNRAWIRLSLGEPLAAVRAGIARSMEIDGAAPEYHVALGLILERGGDRPGAVREFGAALSFAPEIADSKFATDLKTRDLAMWRMCLAEAIARLRARNPDGQDVANQAAVARLLIEQGDLDAARRMLERVTGAMPQFSRAWANLGYLEMTAGDSAGAEQSLRKALFLDGGFCPARMLLARIQRGYGDEDAAANLEGMCADGGRPPVSQHARRLSRIYRLQGAAPVDDVLPPGLLAYCTALTYSGTAQAGVARDDK